MKNAVTILALLGLGGLLLSSSRQPGRVLEPLPPGQGLPSGPSAPPVLANGTLGHTGIPAGLFWGLPMELIWRIDNAYYAGDGNALRSLAVKTARFQGFAGLAGLIEKDSQPKAGA